MVTQKQLEQLADHLKKLIAKYKKNQNEGDIRRLEETTQAYNAIREVILNCAIKGDLIDMVPVKTDQGMGWEVIENGEVLVRYHGVKKSS